MESARTCTQIRHCTFMGYSSENSIPTTFRRVPCMKEGSAIQVYMHARQRSPFAAAGKAKKPPWQKTTRFCYF